MNRNADTVDAFKRHLNQGRINVPKYFYTGSRHLQILHTRPAAVLLISTFTPKSPLILYCVVADVVTSKMQSISSFDVISIGFTDLNYVILFSSIVMLLLMCYSAGMSLLAMRLTRVSSKLYIDTKKNLKKVKVSHESVMFSTFFIYHC